MATCVVSGSILDPSGAASTSVTVYARLLNPTLVGSTLAIPYEVSAACDASGNFSITVQQSVSVVFAVQYPVLGTEPFRNAYFTATIPATATASFSNIIVVE